MPTCVACGTEHDVKVFADYPVFEKSSVPTGIKTFSESLSFRGFARFFACDKCYGPLIRDSKRWEFFVKGIGFGVLLLISLVCGYVTVQRVFDSSPDSGFGHLYSPVLVGVFIAGYAFWRRMAAKDRLAASDDDPKRVSDLLKVLVDKVVAEKGVPVENAFVCITRSGEASSLQNSIAAKKYSEIVCGSFFRDIPCNDVGKIGLSGINFANRNLAAPAAAVAVYRSMGGDKDK